MEVWTEQPLMKVRSALYLHLILANMQIFICGGKRMLHSLLNTSFLQRMFFFFTRNREDH